VSNPKTPGNGVVHQDNYFMPVAGVIMMILVGIGLAVGATEPGKYGLYGFLSPLYVRIGRDETLDHRIRHQILGYLTENPGEHYNALIKAIGITNGGLVYHLLVLEREGFIRAVRDGNMKRFYPASVKIPQTLNRTPDEVTNEVIQAVGNSPSITQKELVECLAIGDEAAGYHLRKLVREGRLLCTKIGRTRHYYPTSAGNNSTSTPVANY